MGGSSKLAGTHPIGEDSIFYNAGFKSYDITRCKDKVGSWFAWVERNRRLMRRVEISIKVLKWLVTVFIEASKVQRRTVKRWNMKDHFAEFYCTLKYNESGRYINFIALQGQNKSVIITPESTFKGGWGNIAHKIAGFIYEPDETQGITVKDNKQLHRSYKEALFRDRWVTEATEKAEIQSTTNRVRITGGKSQAEKDLLNRCLSAIEVRVYAMNDGHFMFELPSRLAAEHVLLGQWTWKKMKLELEWWKPTTGCWPTEVRRDWVWIRLLGLPMNLWSQKVFKEIGNLCGGYIEMEKETSLKNHLHWARIKVKGDGKRIPREVEITCNDFTYTISVWREAPVTVKFSEKRREEKGKYPVVSTQDQLLQITKEVITAKKVDGHVGSSREGSLMQTKTRSKESGPKFGPILLDPIAGEKARAQPLQILSEDIFNIEITANQMKENKAQSQITPWNRDDGELEVARHMVDTPGKNKEELGEKSTTIMVQSFAEENTNGGAEDVIPLGCEERAKKLLMKIDSNKRETMALEVKGGICPSGINEFKHCFLECEGTELWEEKTKLEGEIANIVKEIWGSRWADYVQLASGTRGGILIMWDKRIWEGEASSVGAYSVSCCFSGKNQDFKWHLTGVYAPNDRWEVGATRGLFTGPWVLCGDFNTVRYPSEKFNCSQISRSMTDLSEFIEDMELIDLDLAGGEFTWRKGERHSTAARLDRFMISEDWDTKFRNIKQSILQRIVSDHSPLMLQCGEWGSTKSYFKFKNWWLTTEAKLRALKEKLKEWSKISQGNLKQQKQLVLNQLADIVRIQDQRFWTLTTELEEIVKNEETAWRQRSRAVWLRQGDMNTNFFHKVANSHRRVNTIDKIKVREELLTEPAEIQREITEYYENLYSEIEDWRPELEMRECPMIDEDENNQLMAPFEA
ncbi:hypothetical protein H5410_005147 [Solanum commersonii]|uniref:DUF4283 domain-containing protein n=1 Tax=Solanum commersonii TaxID=4109 RepID=A0A9J6A5V5_SOLCO|nr:hypothetical protein H5410_005147 [Solanum commersonii]